jgi:hypothetical protein
MSEQDPEDYSHLLSEENAPFPLTERDKAGISMRDEDFPLHTWDALKEAIGKGPAFLLTDFTFNVHPIFKLPSFSLFYLLVNTLSANYLKRLTILGSSNENPLTSVVT